VRGCVHGLRGILTDISQPFDQINSCLGKLLTRLDPAPFKTGITNIRIEKQEAVGHRHKGKNKSDTEKDPGFDVIQRVRYRKQSMQDFLSGIAVDGRRDFAKMRESEIQCHGKRGVGNERKSTQKFHKIVPTVHKPYEDHSPQKTGDNVQGGEHYGLRSAAEVAAEVCFREESRIDADLDDEQDGKHPPILRMILPRLASRAGRSRR
jgi:hypothetical protein